MTTERLFDLKISRVQTNGHWAIVDQGHLHIGPKLTGGHMSNGGFFKVGYKLIPQWFGDIGGATEEKLGRLPFLQLAISVN